MNQLRNEQPLYEQISIPDEVWNLPDDQFYPALDEIFLSQLERCRIHQWVMDLSPKGASEYIVFQYEGENSWHLMVNWKQKQLLEETGKVIDASLNNKGRWFEVEYYIDLVDLEDMTHPWMYFPGFSLKKPVQKLLIGGCDSEVEYLEGPIGQRELSPAEERKSFQEQVDWYERCSGDVDFFVASEDEWLLMF